MRVSIHYDDAGYDAYAASIRSQRRAVIRLNGETMHRVLTADTGAGFVDRYVTDAEGQVIAVDGDAKVERLTGRVEITFEDRPSDGAPEATG